MGGGGTKGLKNAAELAKERSPFQGGWEDHGYLLLSLKWLAREPRIPDLNTEGLDWELGA